MSIAFPAQVFRHDEGRAVTIPQGLLLPEDAVQVRQDGARLVIEAVPAAKPRTLSELLASWEPLDEEIGPIEDLPPDPVNL